MDNKPNLVVPQCAFQHRMTKMIKIYEYRTLEIPEVTGQLYLEKHCNAMMSKAFNDENLNIVISDEKNLLVPSNWFAFLKMRYCKWSI